MDLGLSCQITAQLAGIAARYHRLMVIFWLVRAI